MTYRDFGRSKRGFVAGCLVGSVLLGIVAGCLDSPAKPQRAMETREVSDDELQARLDSALDHVFRRRLDTEQNAAWQVLHGVVAFERDLQIWHKGQRVGAIDYLLNGGQLTGWQLEPGEVDPVTGRRGVRARLEPGSKTGQGHPDQWLGYLSQSGMPPEEEIKLGDTTFTVADFIWQTEWDVSRNPLREYSWTLMALSSYRPTTHRWTAADGREWSFEQLLQIETEEGLSGAACGGTHRLVGLTMAVNQHLAHGGELTGAWADANEMIQYAAETARRYQNPDGSFSTNYFERPGVSVDLADQIRTTGHTLEFLCLALTDEQFQQPWMKRAALRLCELFEQTKEVPLECGALYHAARGLVLYRERMFGPRTYHVEDTPAQAASQRSLPAPG